MDNMNINEYNSDEWEAILSGGDYCLERVKKSLEFGVSDDLRPFIWKFFSKSKFVHGLYAELRNGYDSLVLECINRDVPRTFANFLQFNPNALMHVLEAYSLLDIEVGYCSGMNFIAGILLFVVQDEETAFWVFVYIMYEKDWRGMFLNDYTKLKKVLKDFENMIKRDLPTLYKKLKDNDVEILMLSPYFKTIMSYNIDNRFSVRIMDVFLCDGEEILKNILFKMFKLKEQKIINLNHDLLLHYLNKDLISECYEEFHISTFFM